MPRAARRTNPTNRGQAQRCPPGGERRRSTFTRRVLETDLGNDAGGDLVSFAAQGTQTSGTAWERLAITVPWPGWMTRSRVRRSTYACGTHC